MAAPALGGESEEQEALEVLVTAPIVSFRDPLSSALAVTLPCPSPATVGGLLAAVAGGWDEVDPLLRFGMAFTAGAVGVDLETHWPLEIRGSFGQPVPREHQFLALAELTIWIMDDVAAWERRFRRPVWPLRLGRSQDLATARARRIYVHRGRGVMGGALLPDEASRGGTRLQMTTSISRDRSSTRWDTYRHRLSAAAGGRLARQDLTEALVTAWVTREGRAFHLLPPTHPVQVEDGAIRSTVDDPGTSPAPANVSQPGRHPVTAPTDPEPTAAPAPNRVLSAEPAGLSTLLAKPSNDDYPAGESLTDHLGATLDALIAIAQRVGTLEVLDPSLRERFWTLAAWAALLHDTGKIADGFQRMMATRIGWGHRHEVLSLGFLDWLVAESDDQAWVGVGVATHHRALGGGDGRPSLSQLYPAEYSANDLASALGPYDVDAVPALVSWLRQRAAAAGLPGVSPTSLAGTDPQVQPEALATHAHRHLGSLMRTWVEPGQPSRGAGLAGVLLQGAVTMADHLSSGHGTLRTEQPFDEGYASRLADRLAAGGHQLRPHQREAAEVSGHLVLRAWTGAGKTEGGLLWAARQVGEIRGRTGGDPRLFYTLPYLASINAMADRLADGDLTDHGGADAIGVSHSRAASYHLARSLCGADEEPFGDGRTSGVEARAAQKAVARAQATRLFRELVRVGTPYQLMRGALAGPVHSSLLLDATNSVFVLDELHAYDVKRLGYLLAMAACWAELGGRVAVLSATAPNALVRLVREALTEQPAEESRTGAASAPTGWPTTLVPTSAAPAASTDLTVVEADYQTAPRRHRLVRRDEHLTDPATIELIRQRLRAGESVLVVANNIADAQTLRDELSDHDGHLLHSRFRRGDRSRIEQAIMTHFRSGRRPDDRRGGLVVATQVVEVSLDVDFDVLFTSGAPLDALTQRFGRVNRTGARPPADVIICRPEMRPRRADQKARTPPLYADGVYDEEPTRLAGEILDAHHGREISEASLKEWLDSIYDSPWGEQWVDDVRAARSVWATSFFSWADAFNDRSRLAQSFDRLFDGVEGILVQDRSTYAALLKEGRSVARSASVGRLLAADLLIPLPHYAGALGRWDRDLDVLVIDGEYDEVKGLTEIHRTGSTKVSYELGELI
ncbi:CRISPR-associated helicase Cas3' [Frankia sp. AiPa1]|uniref:CRISPR-associated helicase Cas3' n=1 Tax=Frankia sp. AiPa1 TaxID=573492 RepID=UPI00202B03CE|nr:CRISPR-associated helicase Cas3' [Frankia sp. AiPa1]MCL9758039.1 CRISPR-associated helicase Cas3' [Frankia sp. AiPa1]